MRQLPSFLALAGVLFFLGVVFAVHLGTNGPLKLQLNFGPGDNAYIEGFHPEYEIVEKVATHWSQYDAAVRLPLKVSGGPVTVSYRFARVFPETAQVLVAVDRQPIDKFHSRGGQYSERRATVAKVNGPLHIEIVSDSHERKDMGLKLDWLHFDLREGARVWLTGWAKWQPILLSLLLLGILLGLGWGLKASLSISIIWTLPLSVVLLQDPWLCHRLLNGWSVALPMFGMFLVVLNRFWPVRIAITLMLVAFLIRALLVSNPDFYYPDLRTHARLVDFVRDAGIQFLVSPSSVIEEHGVWVTGAFGAIYAFPYTPAFHLPFALFDISYDDLITALKLAAAAISTLPIALVWVFATRLGFQWAPLLSALTMVIIPTYSSRLSFAFLPALFGHFVDVTLLLFLFIQLPQITGKREWFQGSLLVAGSYLAYVAGVLNTTILLSVLAMSMFFSFEREKESRCLSAIAILGMGVLGGLFSFVLFYRDFLPMFMDIVSRVAGSVEGGESRYPIQSFIETTVTRTWSFFGWWYPTLAGFGMYQLLRSGISRLVLLAWLFTYFILLFGRAKIPDIFLHGHETLFVTPLVCLLSGVALETWMGSGRTRKLLVTVAIIVLAFVGIIDQWSYFSDQLMNAQ